MSHAIKITKREKYYLFWLKYNNIIIMYVRKNLRNFQTKFFYSSSSYLPTRSYKYISWAKKIYNLFIFQQKSKSLAGINSSSLTENQVRSNSEILKKLYFSSQVVCRRANSYLTRWNPKFSYLPFLKRLMGSEMGRLKNKLQ